MGRKGKTECYECQPKPHQKTFPGCTIRNTPSEPVHCIVWAKHLFNQLFGEADPDEDVSPDTEDPEASGEEAGKKAAGEEGEEKGGSSGNVERRSTRAWAQGSGYNTQKLFQKFFNDDIKYLLSMDKLWTKRKKPTPLDWDCLSTTTEAQTGAAGESNLEDQKLWSMAECATVMDKAVAELKELFASEVKKKGEEEGFLVWDKDDLPALNFVTACANIRMQIFNIPSKSRFEVKSMAGNIIPAIATTNAVIAGCIVMEALKILNKQEDKCKTVYLRRQPNPRKKILVTEALEPPNPKCYVCAEKPEVHIKLNMETMTVRSFEEKGGSSGNVERRSTRAWAQDSGYNTQKLFQKFFNDDIKYLLSMDKLWTKRKKPTPLDWDCLSTTTEAQTGAAGESNLEDQKLWSMAECATVMDKAVAELKELFASEVKKKGEG